MTKWLQRENAELRANEIRKAASVVFAEPGRPRRCLAMLAPALAPPETVNNANVRMLRRVRLAIVRGDAAAELGDLCAVGV